MEADNKKLLAEGAKTFEIDLAEKAIGAFALYGRELLKWNQKINLTAIRSDKGIIIKHFLDSLSAFPYLLNVFSLLDIGSGAGFPGIPLKMVCPSLEVTLIDSVRKKVDFQKHIIRTLGLEGIEAIHGRVQDKAILRSLGNQFDAIIARAFSDLQNLLILGLPFLKKGGVVLAMRGEMVGETIPSLSQLEKVPYQLKKIVRFTLPFSSIRRSILIFERI